MTKSHLLLLFLLIPFCHAGAQPHYSIMAEYKEHTCEIECTVLSPDGKTLITADEWGYLLFWDVRTMQVTKKTKEHPSRINNVIFNKSGTRFVTADNNGMIMLWDAAQKKPIHLYKAPIGHVSFALLSPDEEYIYFGGYPSADSLPDFYKNRGLYRVHTTGGSPELLGAEYFKTRDEGGGAAINDGTLDVTGKYVLIAKGRYLYFWGIAEGKFVSHTFVQCIATHLLSIHDYNLVWNEGRMSRTIGYLPWTYEQLSFPGTSDYHDRREYHKTSTSRIAASSTDSLILIGNDGNKLNLWSIHFHSLQVLRGHTAPVISFTFALHDSIIISGGYDGKVIVWGVHGAKIADPVKPDLSTPTVADTPSAPEAKVVFAENNIPVTINERKVVLQSTLEVPKAEFDIGIWDVSVEDGDSISLMLNGEWILKDYRVTKTRKMIHLSINPDFANNYLILYAHNLGTIPPNTAAIVVITEDNKYDLSLSSDLSKSGALNFRLK